MNKEPFPAKGIGQHERVPPSPHLKPPPPGEALSLPRPDPEHACDPLRVPYTLDEVVEHLLYLRSKYGGSMRTGIHHLDDCRSHDANVLYPF